MSAPIIRRATDADVPFLVTCIRSAESSGEAGPTPYERLFDLHESELQEALTDICELELEGLELCYPNFWVAEVSGQPAAALAAWVEAAEGTPSSVLKAQLLAQALGAERFLAARPRLELLRSVDLPRTPGALQLDAIAVATAYRGQGLLNLLVTAATKHFASQSNPPALAEILLLVTNARALAAYKKLGFNEAARCTTHDPLAAALLGSPGRILLQKEL